MSAEVIQESSQVKYSARHKCQYFLLLSPHSADPYPRFKDGF